MANQALENLKKIHDLQKEGEISKILLSLKESKNQVESLGNKISKRLKDIEIEQAQKAAESIKVEVKKEPEVQLETNSVEPISATEKSTEKNRFRNFDNNSNNYKSNRSNYGNTSYNRNNDRYNNPNRNNNNNYNGNRNNFNNKGEYQNNRQLRDNNGSRKDFNRPFNNNRQHLQDKKPRNNNFVSSKGNNFRSFASNNDVPEIDLKIGRASCRERV